MYVAAHAPNKGVHNMGNSQPKPTLQEQIKENKRQIRRGIREIERERVRMERQKRQLENDMRKYAKEGQMVSMKWIIRGHCGMYTVVNVELQGPVKVMAKDYVRTKNNIDKFYNMKSQVCQGFCNAERVSASTTVSLNCSYKA